MRTVNLLPATKQRAMHGEHTRRIVLLLSFLASAFILIALVLSAPTYLATQLKIREAENNLALETKAQQALKISETIARAQEIEKTTKRAAALLAKPPQIDRAFGFIFDIPSERININTFSVKQDGSFLISGNAPTRDDLLSFEEALRSSGRFQEISSPLSNIIKKTNLSFTIQGSVKDQYRL